MEVTVLYQYTCQVCRLSFATKDEHAKFCSRQCYHNQRNSKIQRECQQCGKIFLVFPSVVINGGGLFCSYACRKSITIVTCGTCGQNFAVKISNIARGRGKYCSIACLAKSRFRFTRPIEDRLWSKVRVGSSDQCWEWTGGKSADGHGMLYLSKGKKVYVHRLIYTLAHGPIPDGMQVCHSCDNPPCCNLGHLFLGTQRDNILDSVRKGRYNRPYGEKVALAVWGKVVLTAEIVITARQLRNKGLSFREIAESLNINKSTITHAIKRKTWKHLKEASFSTQPTKDH